MKHSQTNTKPSYPAGKLTGGLTQQSAYLEPQNSAGIWHGEVNLESEEGQEGRCFRVRRGEGDWAGGRGGREYGKPPVPKAGGENVENGNGSRD